MSFDLDQFKVLLKLVSKCLKSALFRFSAPRKETILWLRTLNSGSATEMWQSTKTDVMEQTAVRGIQTIPAQAWVKSHFSYLLPQALTITYSTRLLTRKLFRHEI